MTKTDHIPDTKKKVDWDKRIEEMLEHPDILTLEDAKEEIKQLLFEYGEELNNNINSLRKTKKTGKIEMI